MVHYNIMSQPLITPLSTPTTVTSNSTITSYYISNITVILNTSAQIVVFLLDQNNNYLATTTFTLEGNDYAQWGTSDTYVDTFIQNQISTLTTLPLSIPAVIIPTI